MILPKYIADKIYTVNAFKQEHKVQLIGFNYAHGGCPGIKAVTAIDGEPFATLTVNIEALSKDLPEGHFIVKTYAENEEFSKALMASGDFEDTGLRVPSGYVQLEVWRFKNAS